MKFIKRFFLILFLLIILIYVTNITSIPDSIILFQNEELNLGTIIGVNLDEENPNYQVVQTSSSVQNTDAVEKKKVAVKLFNLINVKEIEVNRVPNTTVIPLGNLIGLKLYTSGVLVIGMTEIEGKKPYENSGIEEGDMIVEVNNKEVTCTAELISTVNEAKGEDLNIKYVRDGVEYVANIEPIRTEKNEYKLGLWVRDGAAGIGTMTYYEPQTGKFAALGHGIIDIDTEDLINISSGELVSSRIASIVKGEEGSPGEIKGSISSGYTIGEINSNTGFGIYGNVKDTSRLNINSNNELEVANRDEIKTGKATILLNLESEVRKEYEIEITKIFRNNNVNNKSMLIKVTDEKLLELTGGIIQGMSGAPIIQNGKFVGAVTHVLVNDPTSGYAVFGDLMIKESREVN